MNEYKEDLAMDKEMRARELADKYLDGLTTPGEERWLARYFADGGDTVPRELEPVKALFAYIGSERLAMAAPSAPKRSVKVRLRLFIASAAAAAVVVFAVVAYANRRHGGYAVIDGRVYTDRQTVNEEALDALHIVASDCGESFDAFELMQ